MRKRSSDIVRFWQQQRVASIFVYFKRDLLCHLLGRVFAYFDNLNVVDWNKVHVILFIVLRLTYCF